ncbi:hypothetical protein BGZ73_000389 [Actinomortierella ambigua]|nr:hypothetical protein BGZ73_000389 [Actinomortierella ambigua]
MQALTPILINLLFPRPASAQADSNEPSAFSDGYLEDRDDFIPGTTHHERRMRQARRHHSTGVHYGRSSLHQLAGVNELDGHPGAMPRKNKRLSLDTYALFDTHQQSQHHHHQRSPQPQLFSHKELTSISSARPLASHRPATAVGLNITGASTTSSASNINSRNNEHRGGGSDLYYQPGDEHEHLVESEWVVATSPTSMSSPRPSTCSITSSFSSSSSSYSSLCEPLTPTSASHSHYHSNDHFKKPSSSLHHHSQQSHHASSAHYALSNKDTAAGQPSYFVNLASHQWSALDDE